MRVKSTWQSRGFLEAVHAAAHVVVVEDLEDATAIKLLRRGAGFALGREVASDAEPFAELEFGNVGGHFGAREGFRGELIGKAKGVVAVVRQLDGTGNVCSHTNLRIAGAGIGAERRVVGGSCDVEIGAVFVEAEDIPHGSRDFGSGVRVGGRRRGHMALHVVLDQLQAVEQRGSKTTVDEILGESEIEVIECDLNGVRVFKDRRHVGGVPRKNKSGVQAGVVVAERLALERRGSAKAAFVHDVLALRFGIGRRAGEWAQGG